MSKKYIGYFHHNTSDWVIPVEVLADNQAHAIRKIKIITIKDYTLNVDNVKQNGTFEELDVKLQYKMTTHGFIKYPRER